MSPPTPEAVPHQEEYEPVHLHRQHSPEPEAYQREEKRVEENYTNSYEESPVQHSPVVPDTCHHEEEQKPSPEPVVHSPEPVVQSPELVQSSLEPVKHSPEPAENGSALLIDGDNEEDYSHRDKRSVKEDEEDYFSQKAESESQNGSAHEEEHQPGQEKHVYHQEEHEYNEKHHTSPDHEKGPSPVEIKEVVKEPEVVLQTYTYLESQEQESPEPEKYEQEVDLQELQQTHTPQDPPVQHSLGPESYHHESEEDVKEPEQVLGDHTQGHESPDTYAYQHTGEQRLSPEPVEANQEPKIHDQQANMSPEVDSPVSAQVAAMAEVVVMNASEAGSEHQHEEEHFQRHKRSIEDLSDHVSSHENHENVESPVIPSPHEQGEIVCEEDQCYIRTVRASDAVQPENSSAEQRETEVGTHDFQVASSNAHEEQPSPASLQEPETPVSDVRIEVTPSPSLASEDLQGQETEKNQQEKVSAQHHENSDEALDHQAKSPEEHQEDVNGNLKEDDISHTADDYNESEKGHDHLEPNHPGDEQKTQQDSQQDDVEEPIQAINHQPLAVQPLIDSDQAADREVISPDDHADIEELVEAIYYEPLTAEPERISPDNAADIEELVEAIYHKPLTTEQPAAGYEEEQEASPRSELDFPSKSPENMVEEGQSHHQDQHYSQDSLDQEVPLQASHVINTDLSARSMESTHQPEDNFETQPTMEVEEANSPRAANYTTMIDQFGQDHVSINNEFDVLDKEVEHIHPDHFFSPSSAEETVEEEATQGSRKSSIIKDHEEHLVTESAALELANQEELFSNEHEYNEPEPERGEISLESIQQEYQLESTRINNGGTEHSFALEPQPASSASGNKLLAQPSIEITPASEHGDSVEEHMDRVDVSTPNSEHAAASPTHEEHEVASLANHSVESEEETHNNSEVLHSATTQNIHEDHNAVNGNDVNQFNDEEQDKSYEKTSSMHHELDDLDHHTAIKAGEIKSDEEEDEEDDSDSVIIHNQKHEQTHLDGTVGNRESNGNHF